MYDLNNFFSFIPFFFVGFVYSLVTYFKVKSSFWYYDLITSLCFVVNINNYSFVLSICIKIFFILGSTILYNKCALHYLNTYASYNNFVKWLALKAFEIYNKRSKNCCKNCYYFRFLYETYFLLAHFYFKCNLKYPEWY